MNWIKKPVHRYGNGHSLAIKLALRNFTLEGAFANVFITFTGGAFITGLALLLGANHLEIGLLAAIPFASQLAQLVSGYITWRFKSRKTAVLLISGVSRQIWWIVVLILLLDGEWRLQVLFVVVLLSNVGIMSATPSWLSWLADTVPEKLRGRYFGVRNAVLALVAVVSALAGGVILDFFRARNHENLGFLIIVAVSCLFAAFALRVIQKIPRNGDDDTPERFSLQSLLEPLRNRSYRKLLKVFFVWNLAIGIAAAFFAPHMISNLEMSFTMISVYTGLASVSAIVSNRAWGILIDRFGSKPVVALCAFGIAAIPFVWLFSRPDFLWILLIETVYTGVLWAGFNLAAFNIPIANSPRRNRTNYLAMFSVVTGLAFFFASLIGGVLAEMWSDVSWRIGPQVIKNYHLVFIISGILRLISASVILSFHEHKEKSVPIMLQFMGYSALKRISLGRQFLPKLHKPDND